MRHMTEKSMNNNQSSEITYKSKQDELKSPLSGKLCYSNSERFEPARSHFESRYYGRTGECSREAEAFDSEGDYHTGCRKFSHYKQQSYSGLRSPEPTCILTASKNKRWGLYLFVIDNWPMTKKRVGIQKKNAFSNLG